MRLAPVLFFLLAAVFAPLALACDKCGKPPSAETKKSGKDKDFIAAHEARRPGKEYEIRVPDMGCDNCVKVLREKLKTIEGVIEVEGDLDNKTLKVRVEDARELKEEDAKKIIKGSGYTWGGIKKLGESKDVSEQDKPAQECPREKQVQPAPKENHEAAPPQK